MDITFWKFLIFRQYVAALATQPGNVSNTVKTEKGRCSKVRTHSHCMPEAPSSKDFEDGRGQFNPLALELDIYSLAHHLCKI